MAAGGPAIYEWRTGADNKREPLDLSLATGDMFAFAALWAAWKDPAGDWLRSCTIMMEDDWLDPDLSVEHALSLLEPYPSDAMRSVAVSPLVNNVKNEGPELLERVETPQIGLSESGES